MSILLDSLRKSEARRNIREAPSIHSGPEGAEQRPAGQRGSLVLMAITLAAISWLGWKQYEAPDRIEAASAQQAQTPGASESSRSDAPADTSGVPGDTRTPVERLSAEEGTEVSESGPGDNPSPLDRIAVFSGEDEGDDFGEAFAERDDDTVTDEFTEEETGFREPGDDQSGEEFGGPEERAAEVRAAVDSIRPAVDEPRSYWQLPQAWRSEMPEFKISVLVFADTPEDRFILMNGERLREGEEVENGLLLEEIRRDGAVFSYNGTKFLVKS